MDDYHWWMNEDGWGPAPKKPTTEDIVKALKKNQAQKCCEEPTGRIKVEVEHVEKEKPLTLRDLAVGETFSYPIGTRAENVYMVLQPRDSEPHLCQFVMLRNGSVYDASWDTVIRRRACSLKVAP